MITFHAGILFASYGAFFLAVLTGVAFLVQESQLKRKDPAILLRPTLPLEALDRVNLYSVVIGFGLFSLGMVPGLFLARHEWGSYFSGDPKELWSFLTWGAYAGVLGLRLRAGLKGRRVVFMSVMSFLLVLFTFIGVNHWVGSRHSFF